MSSNADAVVAANDWSKVTLARKWWFQVVLALLIAPAGLLLMIFVPAYQLKKGTVGRIGKGIKILMIVLVSLAWMRGLALLADAAVSDQLQVRLNMDRSLLIRNIGEEPIEIQEVEVNRRPECKAGRMTAKDADTYKPHTLQVGETAMWVAACSVVRANIKTNKGPYEYSFVH